MLRGTFISTRNRGFVHGSSPLLFATASLVTALLLIFTFMTIGASRIDFNRAVGGENPDRAFFAAANAVFTALSPAHLYGASTQPSDVASTPPSPRSHWYERASHYEVLSSRTFANRAFGRRPMTAAEIQAAERQRLARRRMYLKMALQGLAILRSR